MNSNIEEKLRAHASGLKLVDITKTFMSLDAAVNLQLLIKLISILSQEN